jgi:hypothetical protein
LIEIDSISLAETDTLSLGKPIMLQLGSNREVYVADAFHDRVVKFNSQGTLVQTYARKGKQDGEIEQLFSFVLIADSILLVFDQKRHRANVFSVRDGKFLRALPYVGIARNGVTYGDSAYIGMFNPTNRTAVAMWRLDADSLSYAGYSPKEYSQAPALAGIHSFVAVARSSRGILAGYSGVDSIVQYSATWKPLEAGMVRASKRADRPTDLVGFFKKRRPISELIQAVSALDAIGVLESGSIAVLHMDLRLVAADNSMTGTPILGLLGENLKASCGERRMKIRSDSRPIGTFQGDTLALLVRTVTPQGQSRSAVLRWIVSDSGCQWQ